MSHFPLFVDLTEETVLLIGEVSEEKERLLASFGCRVERRAVLTEELLDSLAPALVVIGQGDKRNETWAALCRERGIDGTYVILRQGVCLASMIGVGNQAV